MTAREDVPALIAEANKALAENQWTSGWGVESLADRLADALEVELKRADAAIRAGEEMNASADILDERIYSLTQERDALAARVERLEATLADAADSEAAAVHRADRLQSRLAEVEQERDALAGAQRAANVGEPPRDFHSAGANEGAPAVTDGKIGRPASPATREELADAIREDAYDSWNDVPEEIADALLARFNITARSEGGES